MKENTFTYTARSATNPEKMAMFTLHNGSVSVQLGNALMEQAEQAYQNFRDEGEGAKQLADWIKPVATGSVQKLLQPIPLQDFDAEMKGDSLRATAWIRAGGLRLAPVMMAWQEVDNPEGAEAFVSELHQRTESASDDSWMPDPFDYWASWLVLGLMTIALPIVLMRKMKQRSAS